MPAWEPAPDWGLAAPGPPIGQPRRTQKKCCYSQKSWGSICCSFVHSPTYLSHITLSEPFRIKCERYIFLKNCVRSSLFCWLCFRMHRSIQHQSNRTQAILLFTHCWVCLMAYTPSWVMPNPFLWWRTVAVLIIIIIMPCRPWEFIPFPRVFVRKWML